MIFSLERVILVPNLNVESHFSRVPSAEIQRSMFDRSSRHLTSLNVGDLVPLYVDEILPGDSVNMTMSSVVRAQTMLTPVMDNAYLDTYAFFVPSRLLWSHWRDFCGENNESAWIPSTQYFIPRLSSPAGGFETGTLADYFGLPVGVEWTADGSNAPSALPFRAYAMIVDSWFRDQNLQDPVNIYYGDASTAGSNGSNYITDLVKGGKPFVAAKFHDYFTSCLPSAQKGTPVTWGSGSTGSLPVVTQQFSHDPGSWPVLWNANGKSIGTSTAPPDKVNSQVLFSLGNTDPNHLRTVDLHSGGSTFDMPAGSALLNNTWYGSGIQGAAYGECYYDGLRPTNLVATGTTYFEFNINDLRLAFQLQKYMERLARSGSRYPEILLSQFGVVCPDASLQRPEYLGGTRIPLNVQQVQNTAQTDTDFLGDVGALSVTSDVSDIISKSFTEYGYLLVLGVIRYDHTYAQGLERFWTRHSYHEFYNPVFANIGEQPVKSCEICATQDNITIDHAFGFQEAWADYRYKPNRVSGEMRPGIPNTLASWHYADYYSAVPTLSAGWIREDKTNVDRTLAVTSRLANQFFGDFYFNAVYTRPMPVYSIPGLIDHN